MILYRRIALISAFVFALVGLIFVVFPAAVLHFFNSWSGLFKLPPAPESETGFFLILAVAYMYLVTLLAFMIYRNPKQKIYAQLLINAKLASSVLSFGFFLFQNKFLILLINGVVDGSIGALFLYLKFRQKDLTWL
jgi:hypothetical protein